MSDEPSNPNLRPWIDPEIEARIVALVLGEASDFEREELERMIAEDRDLAEYCRRIEAVHGLIEGVADTSGESGAEPQFELPTAMREELLAAFEAEPGSATSDSQQDGDAEQANVAAVAVAEPPEELSSTVSFFPFPGRLRYALAIAALVAGMAVVGVMMMPTEKYDRVSLNEGAAPVTGDLPMLGRFFRSGPEVDARITSDFETAYDNIETTSLASTVAPAGPSTADAIRRAREALGSLNYEATLSDARAEPSGEQLGQQVWAVNPGAIRDHSGSDGKDFDGIALYRETAAAERGPGTGSSGRFNFTSDYRIEDESEQMVEESLAQADDAKPGTVDLAKADSVGNVPGVLADPAPKDAMSREDFGIREGEPSRFYRNGTMVSGDAEGASAIGNAVIDSPDNVAIQRGGAGIAPSSEAAPAGPTEVQSLARKAPASGDINVSMTDNPVMTAGRQTEEQIGHGGFAGKAAQEDGAQSFAQTGQGGYDRDAYGINLVPQPAAGEFNGFMDYDSYISPTFGAPKPAGDAAQGDISAFAGTEVKLQPADGWSRQTANDNQAQLSANFDNGRGSSTNGADLSKVDEGNAHSLRYRNVGQRTVEAHPLTENNTALQAGNGVIVDANGLVADAYGGMAGSTLDIDKPEVINGGGAQSLGRPVSGVTASPEPVGGDNGRGSHSLDQKKFGPVDELKRGRSETEMLALHESLVEDKSRATTDQSAPESLPDSFGTRRKGSAQGSDRSMPALEQADAGGAVIIGSADETTTVRANGAVDHGDVAINGKSESSAAAPFAEPSANPRGMILDRVTDEPRPADDATPLFAPLSEASQRGEVGNGGLVEVSGKWNLGYRDSDGDGDGDGATETEGLDPGVAPQPGKKAQTAGSQELAKNLERGDWGYQAPKSDSPREKQGNEAGASPDGEITSLARVDSDGKFKKEDNVVRPKILNKSGELHDTEARNGLSSVVRGDTNAERRQFAGGNATDLTNVRTAGSGNVQRIAGWEGKEAEMSQIQLGDSVEAGSLDGDKVVGGGANLTMRGGDVAGDPSMLGFEAQNPPATDAIRDITVTEAQGGELRADSETSQMQSSTYFLNDFAKVRQENLIPANDDLAASERKPSNRIAHAAPKASEKLQALATAVPEEIQVTSKIIEAPDEGTEGFDWLMKQRDTEVAGEAARKTRELARESSRRFDVSETERRGWTSYSVATDQPAKPKPATPDGLTSANGQQVAAALKEKDQSPRFERTHSPNLWKDEDDETSRSNVNTRAGGTAWDTPRAGGEFGRNLGSHGPGTVWFSEPETSTMATKLASVDDSSRTTSFPVTPATPTANSLDSAPSSLLWGGQSADVGVTRELINPSEYNPPEIPNTLGNSISFTRQPGTLQAPAVDGRVASNLWSEPVDIIETSLSRATASTTSSPSTAGITDSYGSEYLVDPSPPMVQNHLIRIADEADEKSPVPNGLDEIATDDEPFSTFSLHVSDVSFTLAKTALDKGEWPDAERIRVEEFVNAFDYGDPLPSLADKVGCQMEQTIHPFLQQRNLLRLSMRTAAAGRSQATPLNLTLVLDHSGSMERHDRQQTVQHAFARLADQLGENDTVTVVGFARQPRLLVDRATGNARDRILAAAAEIPSEGGTHLESALDLAFEKAREQFADKAQNRIILLTDGAANLGDADPQRLAEKVHTMREAGVAFDAAGIGADGLNDEILEALTRKGDGRYYLLDQPGDADENFARQIAGALRPAAMNVKVQIEFNPERVASYKLLGFEKHRLKKEDFRDDKVDAAEIAAEEAGVAVYQFEPLADGKGDVGTAFLRFRDMSSGQMVEKRWPIAYAPDAPRPDQASPKIRLATAAALFAAKLKGDALGATVDLAELTQLIDSLPPQLRNLERVQQLHAMIEKARNLDAQ